MVSASGPEAAFTVVARDRAIKVLDAISTKLGTTTQQMSRLTSAALRASAIFHGLSIIIPVVGGLLAALIAGAIIPNMIEFAIASRRARIQLQFMGLDATNARAAVEAFSNALDRATATSLLQNKDAIAGVALAGADLAISLGLLADELATVTGLDVTEVFNALIQARLFDNVEPLLRLVGGITGLSDSLGDLSDKSPEEIIQLLMDFLTAEHVTNAEGLAAAFKRLSEITLPTREGIGELVTSFLLILVLSFEERLTLVQDNIKTIVLAILTGGMLTAGRGLGVSLGTGLLLGLITFLLLDFENTIDTAFENPLIVANILAAAIILGQVAGKGMVAGIVIALGLLLLPGLKDQFDKLSRDAQLELTVVFLGTALGIVLRQKLIASLGLGLALSSIAKDLATGAEGGNTRIAFGLVGAVIGAILGKSIVTATIGFFVGTTLFDLIEDTGWFRDIEFVFILIDTVMKNILTSIARNTITIFESALNGIIMGIQTFIDDLNDAIRLMNNLFPGNIPLIPDLPRATIPVPGGLDPVDLPTRREARPPTPTDRSGGIPGQVPRIGPEGVQGIFRGISDTTGEQQPLVIQLILDRKVIEEISINALRREIRFKSGLTPGSL